MNFGQIFEKISISVKFSKNFDFFDNFEKFRFSSNIRKISILVKFLKNFDFGQIFQKNIFFSEITKNFHLSQISNI